MVGIRFCYPAVSGRVVSVDVPAPDDVTGLVEACAMVGPGADLKLPPDGYLARYAYLIGTAGTPTACAAVLDEAAAATTVVLDHG